MCKLGLLPMTSCCRDEGFQCTQILIHAHRFIYSVDRSICFSVYSVYSLVPPVYSSVKSAYSVGRNCLLRSADLSTYTQICLPHTDLSTHRQICLKNRQICLKYRKNLSIISDSTQADLCTRYTNLHY